MVLQEPGTLPDEVEWSQVLFPPTIENSFNNRCLFGIELRNVQMEDASIKSETDVMKGEDWSICTASAESLTLDCVFSGECGIKRAASIGGWPWC